MRRLMLVAVGLLLACTTFSQPSKPRSYAERFALSEIHRFPEAWMIDFCRAPFFGYSQGVGCCAMLALWEQTGDDFYFDYVEKLADTLVNEQGEIHRYERKTYNLDFINSGKYLFDCYAKTGKEKYRLALDRLVDQLREQPRTSDGGFWHKLRYTHQMWLDGLYMCSPVLMEYGATFNQPEWIEEAVKQIRLCHLHTYDPATGLYHHAWDESCSQKWADPETGHSPSFWGRSIGWWFMALVDNLDFLPADHPAREEIIGYIRGLAESLPRYARNHLWYQVLDCPERAGNYPEATVTAQFMYAYAKAANRGYIDRSYRRYAEQIFEALRRELIMEDEQGILSLTQCCAVGGLGGNPYRDGSFEYYIGERVRDNDAKGTGPFIMGCIELNK
ncbi:MAG: glycoside hydrolase family 88 protein [Alistipes sp.]|nr:glycoside hydrolase family 88 protein [Alistipes sp.]